MNTEDYIKFLEKEIHTTIIATVDEKGLPVTCAIDIMYSDEKGLYFLTAKGKGFYHRLIKEKFIALTGIKGEDTMHCVAVSVRGNCRESRQRHQADEILPPNETGQNSSGRASRRRDLRLGQFRPVGTLRLDYELSCRKCFGRFRLSGDEDQRKPGRAIRTERHGIDQKRY